MSRRARSPPGSSMCSKHLIRWSAKAITLGFYLSDDTLGDAVGAAGDAAASAAAALTSKNAAATSAANAGTSATAAAGSATAASGSASTAATEPP